MRFKGKYVVAAAVAASAFVAMPAAAQTSINFAKVGDGTAVSTQFPGVTFSMSGGPSTATTPVVNFGELRNTPSGYYPTNTTLTAAFTNTASAVSFAFNNYGTNGVFGDFGSSYTAYASNGTVISTGSLASATGGLVTVAGSNIANLVFSNGQEKTGFDWYFGITSLSFTSDVATAAPEPATWLLMIAGFGMVGFALRRKPVVATKITYA